ncbi:MAG: glutamate--tRNA ligase [Holosporaceae bacterium]|nr:glutamate--tRNA ligase [Holosporaceae bacterium]
MSDVRVRFAPSPTGMLHVGNIRIAILNYLFAKKNGGKFILRIDDTDQERSLVESEESILEDLLWLGIQWDEFYRQSDNLAKYNAALDFLKKKGRVYPCYETKEELSRKRKVQVSRGESPIYDRAAKKLSEEDLLRLNAEEGVSAYWRFLLDETRIVEWEDLVHGKILIPLASVSDPILIKPDGSFVYAFASVIDDINLGITHIIRGDDHITNTAVQLDIFRAMSASEDFPVFAHVPLLSSLDGQDISKRFESSLSIVNMRNAGVDPWAIWCVLANIGTSNNVRLCTDFEDLMNTFSLNKMSLSSPKFNPADIAHMTQKIISKKSFEEVNAILGKNISAEFWDMIKDNLHSVGEVSFWENVFFNKINVIKEDKNFLCQMLKTLPNPINFDQWIRDLQQISGKKGRDLFHPLRIVLTGLETGPELVKIVNFLGYNLVKARIENNLYLR